MTRGVVTAFGLALAFVLGTALAVVVHLDLPASRRLVLDHVNRLLEGAFVGSVRIERVERIGLFEIVDADLRVRDRAGVLVLRADDVSARIGVVTLSRSLMSPALPIAIAIPDASVGHLDVTFDERRGGPLLIADAFEARSTPKSAPAAPGRAVWFDAPKIEVAHAWIHRQGPTVDVDLSDLTGQVHVDEAGATVRVEHVEVVSRGAWRGLDLRGVFDGDWASMTADSAGAWNARFDGAVGGMTALAEAHGRGDAVEARVDALDPTGARARAVFSELAIHDRLELRVTARGTLPHLDTTAALSIGRAKLDAAASIDGGATPSVALTVSGSSVDLSRLAGGPRTELGFDGSGHVVVRNGEPSGRAALVVKPGVVDGVPSPKIELSTTFDRRAEVSARIHDPSMPTEVRVAVGPRADGREGHAIDATLDTAVPDLRRVPLIGARMGGRATLGATARLRLPEMEIEAMVDVRAAELTAGEVSVGDARGQVSARGALRRPVVDTWLDARGVVAEGRTMDRVELRTRLATRARGVWLEDPRVALVRGSRTVRATASSVTVEDGTLTLEGAEVTGLGEPIRGDLAYGPRFLEGRVDAPRIDLATVSELLEPERAVRHGRLAMRGSTTLRAGVTDVDLHAELADFDAGLVHGARGVLDATLHDHDVAVDARAELGDAGELSLRTNLSLEGHARDPSAWKRARGALRANMQIDAEKASSVLPSDLLPQVDLRGLVAVQARVGRDRSDGPPEARLSAQTRGLFVAERPPRRGRVGEVEIEGAPRWRSTDVDLGLDAGCDGVSGLTSLAVRAVDRHGIVAAVDLKAIVPWTEIVREPGSFEARLMSAPLSSKLVVPSRRLDELPALFAMKGVEGVVDLDVDASGTLSRPHVRLVGQAREIRSPVMPPGFRADADVTAAYDDGVTHLALVTRAGGRELLGVSSRVEASLPDALRGSPSRWSATGRARLTGFPLQTIPTLADRGVRGVVRGELSIEGLHRSPRLRGDLDVDGLAVGETAYRRGTVSIDAGERAVAARARLDGDDGFMEVAGEAGLAWTTALAPALDASKPVEATISARALRAAIFQPLLMSVAPRLDGRIDGDATLSLTAGQTPRVEGVLAFRDGSVLLTAVGEELRSARARVTLSPDGRIAIDDVFARGARGEVSANGSVLLHGTRFVEATAEVRVPSDRPLNLAPEGQPIGQVSGSVHVKANEGDDGTMRLAVEVPRARLELPSFAKGGLQPLERRDNVRVGVFRDPTTFTTLPLGRADVSSRPAPERASERTEIAIRLRQVEVIRGNSAQATISGRPTVTIVDDVARIRGQIELNRGWATVQGNKFELERGTVTWSGEEEPDDPTVVATAAWMAPDGTRIFADFLGPVSTGRVSLRSEPPLPKSDILALVLFGTASGANPTAAPSGSQPDGTTRAALGLGADVAAEGLANALDDLTGLRATARIDTTRSHNLRPELEIQLSPRVSISFAHVLGTPPAAEPDRNFASLEYRFYRNWSIETTAGDRGRAVVDAIWQRRY